MSLEDCVNNFYRTHHTPVSFSKSSLVLSSLKAQLRRSYARYSTSTFTPTGGTSILYDTIQHILNSDLNVMQYDNDTDRVEKGILPYVLNSETPLDPLSGAHTKPWFINNKTSRSIIVPTHPIEYKSSYPIDGDWRDYRPFRMVNNDSQALSLTLVLGKLDYRRDPPDLVCFTFDVVAATLQYLYLKRTDGIELSTYVYQYLVYPALLIDNINNWLFRQYKYWLSEGNVDYANLDQCDSFVVDISGITGFQSEVSHYVSEHRTSSAGVDGLCGNLPLVKYDTVRDALDELLLTVRIIRDPRHYLLRIITLLPHLELILAGCSTRMQSGEVQDFITKLRHDLYTSRKVVSAKSFNDPYLSKYANRILEKVFVQTDFLYDMM